jgi:hypothetical protein
MVVGLAAFFREINQLAQEAERQRREAESWTVKVVAVARHLRDAAPRVAAEIRDCLPQAVVFGDVGDLYEWGAGVDLCTGEKLTPMGRFISGMSVVLGSGLITRRAAAALGLEVTEEAAEQWAKVAKRTANGRWSRRGVEHVLVGEFKMAGPNAGRLAGGLHIKDGLDQARRANSTWFTPISEETLGNGVIRIVLPDVAFVPGAIDATATAARAGRGVRGGKTLFPSIWSPDSILDAIEIVARNGIVERTLTSGTIKRGAVSGVLVEVIVAPDGKIVSGFPTWTQ